MKYNIDEFKKNKKVRFKSEYSEKILNRSDIIKINISNWQASQLIEQIDSVGDHAPYWIYIKDYIPNVKVGMIIKFYGIDKEVRVYDKLRLRNYKILNIKNDEYKEQFSAYVYPIIENNIFNNDSDEYLFGSNNNDIVIQNKVSNNVYKYVDEDKKTDIIKYFKVSSNGSAFIARKSIRRDLVEKSWQRIYLEQKRYVDKCIEKLSKSNVNYDKRFDAIAERLINKLEHDQKSAIEYINNKLWELNHADIKIDKLSDIKESIKLFKSDKDRIKYLYEVRGFLNYEIENEVLCDNLLDNQEYESYKKRNAEFNKYKNNALLSIENEYKKYMHNVYCRKRRFMRKAWMNDFNYFTTITYDDKKMNELEFKNKIKKTLQNLRTRKNWTYMGVFERGGNNNRLHLHILINIPEGYMIGNIIETKDYSFKSHCNQIAHQNTYFQRVFGRNDFQQIKHEEIRCSGMLEYLLKYITKTDEKCLYSRGIPESINIDEIALDDIICNHKNDYRQYLLYDDCILIIPGVRGSIPIYKMDVNSERIIA